MALHGNPTFRRLYGAQIVGLLGTGIMTVALGLLAFDLAGDDAGQVLSTALAVKMVAYVAMAPIMRAALARFSTTAVLIGADVVRASTALALPFLTSTWQIYLLVFALQTASATFTPTFQAVVARIVPDRDDYTRAISASRIAYDTEAIASPMIAAALLTVVDYSLLFVGTCVGFAASAALVTLARIPAGDRSDAPPPTTGLWRRTSRGVGLMVRRGALRGVLAGNVVVATSTALVVVNTVVYVRGSLGGSESAVALLLAAFGVGSIAAAVGCPALIRRVGLIRTVMIGTATCTAALACTALLLAALGPQFLPLGALWAALGAGAAATATSLTRILRDHTTDADRGDVFTAQFSCSHAVYLVTYPLVGWGGVAVGQVGLVVVLALLAAVGGMGAWVAWSRAAAGLPADAREPACTLSSR